MSFHNAQLIRQRATQAPPSPPPLDAASAPPPAAKTKATTPVATVAPNFESASLRVAEAEAAAAKAGERVREAQARLDQVNERIADLEGKRAGIVARRTAGELQDDDGPTLALLAADLEGLTKLRIDAASALALVQSEHATAQRHVDHARHGLQRAEDRQTYRRLADHATELRRLLLEAIGRTAALEDRLSLSPDACWSASPQLIDALRRQAFASRKGW